MSRRHLTMLLVLSLIWGASFMFIKVAVRELEPSTLIWVRVGLGAVTLIPIAFVALGTRESLHGLRADWWPFVVMGLLNTSIPFWLIRMMPGKHFSFLNDQGFDVDADRVRLTSRDLERLGPSLILDQQDRHGAYVIVWTE